jgi:hypothetical protein
MDVLLFWPLDRYDKSMDSTAQLAAPAGRLFCGHIGINLAWRKWNAYVSRGGDAPRIGMMQQILLVNTRGRAARRFGHALALVAK